MNIPTIRPEIELNQSALIKSWQLEESDQICSICLDSQKKGETVWSHDIPGSTTIQKAHSFHLSCLKGWLITKLKENTPCICPVDRTLLQASSVISKPELLIIQKDRYLESAKTIFNYTAAVLGLGVLYYTTIQLITAAALEIVYHPSPSSFKVFLNTDCFLFLVFNNIFSNASIVTPYLNIPIQVPSIAKKIFFSCAVINTISSMRFSESIYAWLFAMAGTIGVQHYLIERIFPYTRLDNIIINTITIIGMIILSNTSLLF